ncbi:MAG: sodium-dependent bicarbonate transport family permease [Opitutales bacterium]
MNIALLAENLSSPPILFFLLGILARLVKSDLEFPQPLPKFFSYYLLLAIGFKGGMALHGATLTAQVWGALTFAVLLSAIMPCGAFFILRKRLGTADAAALAAAYGSISAVTFVTGIAFLNARDVPYGGHMVAAMALMESPAIVVGLLLARLGGKKHSDLVERRPFGLGSIFHEAFFNGSVFLLLGSLAIGWIAGGKAENLMPFTHEIFYGMLCFFLCDMGLVTARRFDALKKAGLFAIGFAILFPLFGAVLALGGALALDLEPGNAFLLVLLGASASYIAVPATFRIALPEANPSLYLPLALGVTFPFNITIGLPVYFAIIELLTAP